MASPTPSMLKLQGDAMFADGSISDAIKLWNDALSVSRVMSASAQLDNADLRHMLHMSIVQGYTRRREWDKVLAHCEAALAEGSKDTKALRWRAIALGRLSRMQEAEAALQDYEAEAGPGDARLAAFTRKELERQKAREGVFTLGELSKCNGEDKGPMYIGVYGKIIDVSSSENFKSDAGYGKLWAGRDATYCLAKMSLKPADCNKLDWNFDDFSEAEQKALDGWVKHFWSKYPAVGTLKEYEGRDMSQLPRRLQPGEEAPFSNM